MEKTTQIYIRSGDRPTDGIFIQNNINFHSKLFMGQLLALDEAKTPRNDAHNDS